MIYIIYFKIPQEKNYDKYDKNTNNSQTYEMVIWYSLSIHQSLFFLVCLKIFIVKGKKMEKRGKKKEERNRSNKGKKEKSKHTSFWGKNFREGLLKEYRK